MTRWLATEERVVGLHLMWVRRWFPVDHICVFHCKTSMIIWAQPQSWSHYEPCQLHACCRYVYFNDLFNYSSFKRSRVSAHMQPVSVHMCCVFYHCAASFPSRGSSQCPNVPWEWVFVSCTQTLFVDVMLTPSGFGFCKINEIKNYSNVTQNFQKVFCVFSRFW